MSLTEDTELGVHVDLRDYRDLLGGVDRRVKPKMS